MDRHRGSSGRRIGSGDRQPPSTLSEAQKVLKELVKGLLLRDFHEQNLKKASLSIGKELTHCSHLYRL